jgi:hypothetical protein
MVQGSHIAWRIRHFQLPFIQMFGQWVNEYVIPLEAQLTARTDAFEKEVYDELGSQPVPENYSGDGWEVAESAIEQGHWFYEQITSMYQTTLNLFAAGFFHAIEQQLADLTRDAAIESEVPDTKLDVVTKWFGKHFLIDLAQFPAWHVIDELRLVANTAKHAEGAAAERLRKIRPDLFQSPIIREDFPDIPVVHRPVSRPLGGDGLYVTAKDFGLYEKTATQLFEWLAAQFESNAEQYFPQ